MKTRASLTDKYGPVQGWNVDDVKRENVRARVQELVHHGDDEADEGSPEDEDCCGDVLALGHQYIHYSSRHTGRDGEDHPHCAHLIRLYWVDVEMQTAESVEYEGRFADQDDSSEELESSTHVDGVKFVPQHDGGEEDGDQRAGEDDGERVRDIYQGDAGQ